MSEAVTEAPVVRRKETKRQRERRLDALEKLLWNRLQREIAQGHTPQPPSQPEPDASERELERAAVEEKVYQRYLNLHRDPETGVPSSGRSPIEELIELEWVGKFYFEPATGKYWMQDAERRWIKVNEKDVATELKHAGLTTLQRQGQNLSDIEDILRRIRREQNVAFAGNLAGYRAGPVHINGDRVLVTSSPKFITPDQGNFPTIEKFLNGLLGKSQLVYFHAWLKLGVETLMREELTNGHILILAGPKGCGKSFLQDHIITPALGGRISKPFAYISGQTSFNSELFGAEHWQLEDESPAQDIVTRRKIGSFIKQLAANKGMMYHAKGREGRTIVTFRRVSMSLNDEPENLSGLPPLDESLSDKLLIFKAQKAPMPMATRTNEEKRAYAAKISEELPAYLYWLLHSFEIPAELIDDEENRFGFKAFQAPEIIEEIEGTAPENQLLELLDLQFAWDNEAKKLDMNQEHMWEPGTASEILGKLTQYGELKEVARKLLPSARVCGIYLGRLEKKENSRVKSYRGHAGYTKYRIWFGGKYRNDVGVTDK